MSALLIWSTVHSKDISRDSIGVVYDMVKLLPCFTLMLPLSRYINFEIGHFKNGHFLLPLLGIY